VFGGDDAAGAAAAPCREPAAHGPDHLAGPVVNGSDDRQFCSAATNCAGAATFDAIERSYFTRAADFETRLISGAGHDLTLSSTTPDFQEAVLEWARRTVPSTSVG